MTDTRALDDEPPHAGLWLPLITPFRDGALDERSLVRLVRHYRERPLAGLVLAATTGEGLTLDEAETERLVAVVAEALEGRMPVLLGLGGADTRGVARALDRIRDWPIDGSLIACPAYVRPAQEGLYRHFAALAGHTGRPMLVYNIPYRTGVNMSNETLLRLAELPVVAGVKDCCSDAAQSFELLCRRPAGFSVLTGEDAQFYSAQAQGADGGITASAHVETERFAEVRALLRSGNHAAALALWRGLCEIPRLLFSEPSPAPVKHWLWRAGLIDSPELRLPMVPVSGALATRIDAEVTRRGGIGEALRPTG
jgi:4-hydroxy-tetrahydrodipicolinate synthase